MYFTSIVLYGLLRQAHSKELVYGNDTFKGVSCAITDETLVVDTMLGMSVGDCKQACLETIACLSVNYIRPFHICQLLNQDERPKHQLRITSQCATYEVKRTIGQYCSSDSDCVENHSVCQYGNSASGGICFCDKLHRYVAARLACIQVCDHILDDFELHDNSWFLSYNGIGVEWSTFGECMWFCVVNPECMSFEYDEYSYACHMSRVTIEMVLQADPSAFGSEDSGTWSLYSRQCAIIH